MILAKGIIVVKDHEADGLDWKKVTGNFNEAIIEAFVYMQQCKKDKLAVVEHVTSALDQEQQCSLFDDGVRERLAVLREYVEKDMVSPYIEIKRLIDEGNYKDQQIDKLMAELHDAKLDHDRTHEEELLDSLVQQAMSLGPQAALYTEIWLRRMYADAPEKCRKQTALLMNFVSQQEKKTFVFNQPVGIVAPDSNIYTNQEKK